MNLELIDYKLFVENDTNPFILFGTTGNIIYLNSAAEMLLCYTQTKVLYDIALTYAPKTFGHKNILHELEFDNFKFYSIMIGYECEEQIYLRLYNRPLTTSKIDINNESLILSDINILLEANLTMFQMQSSAKISLLADQELPEFKLDQNNFSKILRKAFSSFLTVESIDIKLKLLFGEYIVIDNKKYQIIELILKASNRNNAGDDDMMLLTSQTHIASILKQDSIRFQIPLMM
jgi:nitrogen-specific signal transduction histidine kinase